MPSRSRRRRRACCRRQCPRYNCYVPYVPSPAAPAAAAAAAVPPPPGPCAECAKLQEEKERLVRELTSFRQSSDHSRRAKDGQLQSLQTVIQTQVDEFQQLSRKNATMKYAFAETLRRLSKATDSLKQHLEESKELDQVMETLFT